MAITKTVHKWERVVPVRFARAPHPTDPTIASGTYDANAPEPDDRGFLPHSTGGAVLPIGLDEAVAAVARPESRVRLIRMDMENTGQLFVTPEAGTAIFEITLPAANAALPSTPEMMINLRALAAGSAHLQVRFGSIGGPIIHQIRVVVTALFDVPLFAHVPIINGTPIPNPATPGNPFPAQSTRTDAQIQALIDGANTLYFPYGIRLALNPLIRRTRAILLTNQGMVDPQSNEFDLVTALDRQPNAINAYFVPQCANPTAAAANATAINRVNGMATSAVQNPLTYGLFMADIGRFQTVSHECGHLFNLVNDPRREFVHINAKEDPTSPGTGRVVRFDTISRRRFMWSSSSINLGNSTAEPNRTLHNLPFRSDVGYGNNQRGGMLTIKQLNNDNSDLELGEVQLRAQTLP